VPLEDDPITEAKPFGERSSVGQRKLPAAFVDEGVDVAEALGGRLHDGLDLVVLAHVAGPDVALGALLADLVGGRVEVPRGFARARTSFAPSSAKRRDIAFPRPVPPPVTRMTLPLRRSVRNMRAPLRG